MASTGFNVVTYAAAVKKSKSYTDSMIHRGILVGTVTNGGSFPATRPDGSPLQNEDYVKPLASSTFPFTVGSVTFDNKFTQAIYFSGTWLKDPGQIQDTSETPLRTPSAEGITGSEANQAQLNTNIKNLKLNCDMLNINKVDTSNTLKTSIVAPTDYGTAGQIIKTNATADGLVWVDPDKTDALNLKTPATESYDGTGVTQQDANIQAVTELKKRVVKVIGTAKTRQAWSLLATNDDVIECVGTFSSDGPESSTTYIYNIKVYRYSGYVYITAMSDRGIWTCWRRVGMTSWSEWYKQSASKMALVHIPTKASGYAYIDEGNAYTKSLLDNGYDVTIHIDSENRFYHMTTYDATSRKATWLIPSDDVNHTTQLMYLQCVWDAGDDDSMKMGYYTDNVVYTGDVAGLDPSKYVQTSTQLGRAVLQRVDSGIYKQGHVYHAVLVGSVYQWEDAYVFPTNHLEKVDVSTITPDATNIGTIYCQTVDVAGPPSYTAGHVYICVLNAGVYSWQDCQKETKVDDVTIEYNASSELQIKDDGVTTSKIKDDQVTLPKLATQSTTEAGKVYAIKTDGTTELAKAEDLLKVDNVTIENDATNGIQVKDGGISLPKLATQATTEAGKAYTIKSDGTTELTRIRQYKQVHTFTGEVGNDYTMYYLDTPDATNTAGVYVWNSVDGFTLVANTGGSASSTFIGLVTNGDSFPVVRPDGTPLILGDYVKPDSASTFPFTIGTVTFTNFRDTAVYMGSTNWVLNANPYQKTSEVLVNNAASESISGTSLYQNAINSENRLAILNRIEKTDVSTITPASTLLGTIYCQSLTTTGSPAYTQGHLYACVLNGTVFEWKDVYDTTDNIPVRKYSTAYSLDDRVLYPNKYGYLLICTAAGTTGTTLPAWPTTIVSGTTTIVDGTCVWTVYDMSEGGVKPEEIPLRANSKAYVLNDRIMYPGKYGFLMVCTTAGTSNATIPAWPTTISSGYTTLTDGTAVWTIFDMSLGGGDWFEITGTPSSSGSTTGTFDKTAAEIRQAISEGKKLVVKISTVAGYLSYYLPLYNYDDGTDLTLAFSKNNPSMFCGPAQELLKWDSVSAAYSIDTRQSGLIVMTMPTPTSSLNGLIVQYVGTTTSTAPIYTEGYFYKCTSDPLTPTTYFWEPIKVQDDPDIPVRKNDTAYNLDDRVLYPGKYTYALVCTTAGTSDSTEPAWPTSVISGSTTITDGTAVWTVIDMTQGGSSSQILTATGTMTAGTTTQSVIIPAGSVYIESQVFDGSEIVGTDVDVVLPTSTTQGVITFTIAAAYVNDLTCNVKYTDASGVHIDSGSIPVGSTSLSMAIPIGTKYVSSYILDGTELVKTNVNIVYPTATVAGSATFDIGSAWVNTLMCYVCYSE